MKRVGWPMLAGLGLGLALALPVAFWLRGCASPYAPIHLNPNMDRQPKYRPFAASAFFANGSTSQESIPGTIARGELREDDVYFTGSSVWTGAAAKVPFKLDEHDLERGAERYDIFCTPCHGSAGDGLGPVSERTGIATANLLAETIATQRDGQLFKVIGEGSGLMQGYAGQVPVRDRWLIVAHLRQLQTARSAEVAE